MILLLDVDSLDLLLTVLVTTASVQDRDGARLLLSHLGGTCKKSRLIWVNGGYRGQLHTWIAAHCRFRLQVVLRSDAQKGFVLLPRRWVFERLLPGSMITHVSTKPTSTFLHP